MRGGGDSTYHSIVVQGRRYNKWEGEVIISYHSIVVQGRRYNNVGRGGDSDTV